MELQAQIKTDMEKDVQKACRDLMSDSKFRLVMAHLLLQSGIETATVADNTMAYNNGRRSMGLEIARLLDSISKNSDMLYGYKTRVLSLIEYKQREMNYRNGRK